MSFRPHGRAKTSVSQPQAWAICDRCGFLFNHTDLTYQFDWQGPRLQNERILVCRGCNDKPFEHNRSIILPPDPVPIANPRPELYTADNNPVSPTNFDPLMAAFGGHITVTKSGALGNITAGAGLESVFQNPGIITTSSIGVLVQGLVPKKAYAGALRIPSLNGGPPIQPGNYIGQNWSAQPGTEVTSPPAVTANGLTYALSGFTMQAPSDQAFLHGSGSITVEMDGWISSYWSPLWLGASSGSVAEIMQVTLSASAQTQCYGHRVVLFGDGINAVAVASLQFQALGAAIMTTPPPTTPS